MDPRTGLKVLIADDSAELRQRLRALIGDLAGVDTVLEAADGLAALAAIRATSFDAVILDLRMPGRTGMDVLLEARRLFPALVLIVLTNYPYPAYRKRCIENGANFFFDKNTEFMNAVEAVRGLVREPPRPPVFPMEEC